MRQLEGPLPLTTSLSENPALIESAVEEFLRYDSPVQVTDRRATRPTRIGDYELQPGEYTILLRGPETLPLTL